ncbi:hypothetical protein A7975_05260 [Bacillus sp. FJAT-26390]|nr:LD-carboxypeptidase [Bacillus sp. FJAT-26390]OBZ17286.1 hypothetical protein A7975_05260 [Bacillus sp. FJAT-26390]
MRADILKPGDEIRIISPSQSLSLIAPEHIELAKLQLEQLGFVVTFSKNSSESDSFISSSIPSRIEDLHEAFLDL